MSAIRHWCHRHLDNGAPPLAVFVWKDFSGVARSAAFIDCIFYEFICSSSSMVSQQRGRLAFQQLDVRCTWWEDSHSETDEVHTRLKYACNYGGPITRRLYTATGLQVEATGAKPDCPDRQSQPCCLSFGFWGMSPAGAFSAISRTSLNDWPNPNLGRSAKNSAMPSKYTSAGSKKKKTLSCGGRQHHFISSLAFLFM